MSDKFNKYIDTKGRSLGEVREVIYKVLAECYGKNAARADSDDERSAVNRTSSEIRKSAESWEYKSEKIPVIKFEPIEFDPPPPPRYPLRPFEPNSVYYPHESIPEDLNPQDEFMFDKIYEMRGLEKISRNRYIVKRCALDNLIIQGDFMADVEDDFERKAFFGLDMPLYAAMSNSQLRTYFTWRTDFRRGKILGTDISYVILYCFELMNKIGVTSSDEAFDKLCAIWENRSLFTPHLETVMPNWIKDFYAFNNITRELPNFPAKNPRAFSLEDGVFSGKFELLAEYSAYPIGESAFLTDETRPLMDGACAAVLNALSEYFAKRELNLSEILCGSIRTYYSWEPFKDALVDLDRQDGFHDTDLGFGERYCKKRGKPALEYFDFSPSRGIIGYILKSAESELRVRTGKGRRITANVQMMRYDICNRTKLSSAIEDAEFTAVISKSVNDYCDKHGIFMLKKSAKTAKNESSEYVREKVQIDVSKLEKIREESDALAQKLIIPEADEIEEVKPAHTEKLPETTNDIRVPDDLSQEWQNLARSLSSAHIGILNALMSGNGTVFCRERNLMPETVFEEINSSALEQIGDVIIENGEILEDYSAEIMKIIKSVL